MLQILSLFLQQCHSVKYFLALFLVSTNYGRSRASPIPARHKEIKKRNSLSSQPYLCSTAYSHAYYTPRHGNDRLPISPGPLCDSPPILYMFTSLRALHLDTHTPCTFPPPFLTLSYLHHPLRSLVAWIESLEGLH